MPYVHELAPIRQSIFVFTVKLFLVLFLVDTLYAGAGFLISQLGIPQEYYHHLFITFLIVHLLKNALQIYLALKIVFHWISNVYFIHDRQLIKREGLLHVQEKVYDLNIIRSINVDQSIIGKLFHYGSIYLTTSASGGYNDKIILQNITEPKKCQEVLQKLLSSS